MILLTQTLVPVGQQTACPAADTRPTGITGRRASALPGRPMRGTAAWCTLGYGIYYDQSSLAPGEGLYFNKPYYDFKLYFPLPGLPLTVNDPFPSNYPLAIPGVRAGIRPSSAHALYAAMEPGLRASVRDQKSD